MTQPTGRPRGRPKTKEYVTLMARVPQDLADQAKRYAGQHRQTMSDVLRDGLQLLLDEDRSRPFLSDRKAVAEIVSDTNGVAENVSDRKAVAGNVSDRKEEAWQPTAGEREAGAWVAQELAQRVYMADVQLTDAAFGKLSQSGVPSMRSSSPAPAVPGDALPQRVSISLPAQTHEEPRIPIVEDMRQTQNDTPAYDTTKYVLGKLCPRKHDYQGTGKTLLRLPKRRCHQCENAKKRGKRQAQPASRR